MLRATLGVCGVALIALGVFGGQLLDSAHQAVGDFFEPDTTVAQTAAPAVDEQPVEQSPAQPVVVASSEATAVDPAVIRSVASDGAELAAAGDLTEVKASAKNEAALLKTSINQPSPAVVSPSVVSKEEQVGQIVQTTTGAVGDNTLFVIKERVNLREGPSINHPIVLQLDIGQELMEFKRDGKWVHVGAYGTSGKIGWVHGTLVGKN